MTRHALPARWIAALTAAVLAAGAAAGGLGLWLSATHPAPAAFTAGALLGVPIGAVAHRRWARGRTR